MTATRRLGRLEHKKEQGRKNKRGCALGDDGGGTYKDLSQPGSMAGITSGVRGGAVANGGAFPPRLEGRGIHMEGEKLGLTLVATGRSAGVGEAVRCELAGVEENGGVVQRRGRWRAATTRSGSSSQTAPAWRRTVSSHGRTPSPPAPPLTLLLDVTDDRLGREIPNWLGFEPRATAVFL
jgi:hypothetical protein